MEEVIDSKFLKQMDPLSLVEELEQEVALTPAKVSHEKKEPTVDGAGVGGLQVRQVRGGRDLTRTWMRGALG